MATKATLSAKIGLIVNPVAGMGGSVGLKGSDGEAVLARAVALGARPMAPARALRALRRLAAEAGSVVLASGPGALGEDVALEAGLAVTPLGAAPPAARPTTAADTRAAAQRMRAAGVGLILFAGGDGTARDILEAVGDAVPMLGIPSGVKMHSAVFAVSPEAAGQLAALVAANGAGRVRYRAGEIMDIDEDAVRAGRLSARLYGYASVPFERHLVQSAKAGGIDEDAALDAVCREIAAEMAPGVAYIVGPGTTTQRILRHLGLGGTLLGVDAVRDGALIGADLRGDEVDALVQSGPARVVVSVIGGQGYIFGRGNQPIGAAAIGRVGRDGVIVVAGQRKLLSLAAGRLLADTGDRRVDALLEGYIRVRIGPGMSTMMRVGI